MNTKVLEKQEKKHTEEQKADHGGAEGRSVFAMV
jgi:hypothetical protein